MAIVKTRDKLIDVARNLFAKKGFENTTMNDIATTSGKGRRTLYTYFKSKEEVYFAVIEQEMERLSEKMVEVGKRPMEPEDKLVELIYTHLNLIKEAVQRNGNLRAEFFRNIIMVAKVRRTFDQTEKTLFAQTITEGIRQGKFDIDNLELSVDIMHYCTQGLEIPYIHGRLGRELPKGMSRAIVQKLVHKALKKEEIRY